MKIHITTNGYCAGRDNDIAKLLKYFILNECDIVINPNEADFIIIMTCGFKEFRVKSAFSLIEQLKRTKAEIIVAGCLPSIIPQEFKKKFKGRFVTTRTLKDIDNNFQDFKIKFSDSLDIEFLPLFKIESSGNGLVQRIVLGKNDKSDIEAKLCIVNGCAGNCSYCSIKHSVGRLKSKPLDICLQEFREYISKGYTVIKLVGEDVGAYGIDIGSSFDKLLEKLCSVSENFPIKLRLGHLNPIWLVKYNEIILRLVNENKIDFIQCPIQSGSSRILRLMLRYSDNLTLSNVLNEFKKLRDKLILQTQIIVGFPSETEEDLTETIDFCIKTGFNRVQLYPYFEGPLSDSKRLDEKIPVKVIENRIEKAIKMFELENIEPIYERM